MKKYAIIFKTKDQKTKDLIVEEFTKEKNYTFLTDGMILSPHINPVETIIEFKKYIDEKSFRDNLILSRLIRFEDEGNLLD